MSFELIFAPQTKTHLKAIERRYYSLIKKTIEQQLRFEPDVETNNRKPLMQPVAIDAEWEIRFGPNNRFRVFYTVNRDTREVDLVAIGQKHRNRVFIGQMEIEL